MQTIFINFFYIKNIWWYLNDYLVPSSYILFSFCKLIFNLPGSRMGSKPVEDLIEASTEVHFSGFHLDESLSKIDQATTSTAEDVPKQPFVIGMFGCWKHFMVFQTINFN